MTKVRIENYINFIGESFKVLEARYSIEHADSSVHLMIGIAGEERNDLPSTFMFPNSRLKLEFDLTAEFLVSSSGSIKILYFDKYQDGRNSFYIGEHFIISRIDGKFEYNNGIGQLNVNGSCGIFDEVYDFSICCVTREFPAREVWWV